MSDGGSRKEEDKSCLVDGYRPEDAIIDSQLEKARKLLLTQIPTPYALGAEQGRF